MLHFNIRIVQPGEFIGLGDFAHEDNSGLGALVEFYDPRHTGDGFTVLGQKAASYYAQTLLDDAANLAANGLTLHGGIDAWTVSASQMAEVLETIERILAKA